MHPVTQAELANALGVSQATISMALQGLPGVSGSLRRRIETMARKLGYHPNAGARLLSYVRHSQGTRPVQAELAWLNVWPDPAKLRTYPEFDLYWRGAFDQAMQLGYRLEEFSLSQLGSVKRVEKALQARGIEGILLPPFGETRVDWSNFHWNQFCAVRMSRTILDPPFHLVTADQSANTMLAVQKMRVLGYERIGFMNMIEHDPLPRLRYFLYGFLASQFDLLHHEQVSIFDPPGGKALKGFESWMKKERPNALLVDGVATNLIEQAGYRIPQDIGVALTSVQGGGHTAGILQNPKEIGRVAVSLLTSLIRDNERGIPSRMRQVLIEGEWMDGATLPMC